MSSTFLSPFNSETNPKYCPSIQTPDVLSIFDVPSKRASPKTLFCCARAGAARTTRKNTATRAAKYERTAFDIPILLRLGPIQYCTDSPRQNLKNTRKTLYV